MDPAPSSRPCSARPTSPAAGRSSSSTTRPSRRTRSPARATAPRSSGSRARRRRSSPSTDANQAVGALDPWLGAALSVAEATRNVAITGARPLGVTNCLNYGDPTRPEAFWQLSEAVRGLGDACRALGLPVTGGNVSLYNESPAGAIAPDARRSASSACSTTSRRASGRRWPAPGDGPPRRRGDAGARRQRLRRARRARRRGRPAEPRPRSRAAAPGVRPRGGRPRAARLGPGRLRRRARGRARRVRAVGRRRSRARRPAPDRRRSSPAVDLFGESPSRLVVSAPPRHAPALVLLARQHGLPIEELGEVAAADAGRLVIELAGSGATGAAEERGSRVADALDVALDRPPPRLGARPARALGWDEPRPEAR